MPPARTFYERLCDVLASAFVLAELRQAALFRMNVTLDEVVGTTGAFKGVVFDFVCWCRRCGRVRDLVDAAAGLLPDRGDVQAVRQEFDSVPPDPPPPPEVLAGFATQFAALLPRFEYVQAYKKLHDILHDLDGLREKLDQEQQARAAAGKALPVLTVITLKTWKGQTAEWDKKTDPDAPNTWVPLFVTDVDDLLGPDDDDRTRHRDALANLLSLPAKQLAVMNSKLVAAAHRLRLDGMADLLGVRLDALPALAGAVTAFRRASAAFTTLVAVHDLCQNIDTEVRPADEGQSPRSAGEWPPWKRVRQWLDQLTALLPDDPIGGEVFGAAGRFAGGGGAPAFDEFADAFRVWFLGIDKELLDLVTPLLTSAHQLMATLRTPQ